MYILIYIFSLRCYPSQKFLKNMDKQLIEDIIESFHNCGHSFLIEHLITAGLKLNSFFKHQLWVYSPPTKPFYDFLISQNIIPTFEMLDNIIFNEYIVHKNKYPIGLIISYLHKLDIKPSITLQRVINSMLFVEQLSEQELKNKLKSLAIVYKLFFPSLNVFAIIHQLTGHDLKI